MVRKTKEEAQATRDSILDAAERVFHRKGVGRTSLSEVASEAGVTRGAIYWHFANKGEVFDAMMRRAMAPLESMGQADYTSAERPLEALRQRLLAIVEVILGDPRYLRVFSIAWHKCEYVDELVPIIDQCMEAGDRHLGRIETAIRAARALGQIPAAVDPRRAAMGLMVLLDGLIADWAMQPQLVDLGHAEEWIDCYLRGLGWPGEAGDRDAPRL